MPPLHIARQCLLVENRYITFWLKKLNQLVFCICYLMEICLFLNKLNSILAQHIYKQLNNTNLVVGISKMMFIKFCPETLYFFRPEKRKGFRFCLNVVLYFFIRSPDFPVRELTDEGD